MEAPTRKHEPQEESPARINVVAAGSAWNRRIKRCFSKCDDIALMRGVEPLDRLLSECASIVPFVLLADYDFVTDFDRLAEFSQRIDFGRSVQVLVLVKEERSGSLDRLLRAGCMGYLRDETPPSVVRKAVRAVAAGEVWAPRKTLARLLHGYLENKRRDRLTKRESELLKLVAEGYTNKQMAEALSISHETVRWHMRMLYSKLGVHSREAAASQLFQDD